jgi:hypothetical protein
MKKQLLMLTLGCLLLGGVGCVRTPDVRADAELKRQAFAAFDMGQHAQARRIIARADHYNVPRSKLWRRTLELQIAIAEGSQRGELRQLLRTWGEQRKDWSREDLINAELTLAETLQCAYAIDWLYDLDPDSWPLPYRTRYNLLRSKLQQDVPTMRDDTVARWRLGIQGLYASGNLRAAAAEAERCATSTQNAEAALIAAKLYNELGDTQRKEAALELATEYNSSAPVLQEVGLIRTAPAGTKTNL